MSIVVNSSAQSNARSLLDAALEYARRGWSIIPVIGKEAARLWKPFQLQPADEKTLRRMFADKRITGLAVITGKSSQGLAVRDFDIVSAYFAWRDANPTEALLLPTVRTARGFHVYGSLEEECFANLGDGELRADSGHYVLLPPSLHPDGDSYSWLIPLPPIGTPLPLLPESLRTLKTQATQCNQCNQSNPSIPIACVPHPSDSEIGAIIDLTLPTGPGQRNRKIFDLARQLKTVMPQASVEDLEGFLREWFALALPFIRTKEYVETQADFEVAWQEVRYPSGVSFHSAVLAAKSDIPPIAGRYVGRLQQLVSLCWHLQMLWGDKPFPLGCSVVGTAVGVSKIQANRMLNRLQLDGLLKLSSKGSKRSGKASEWRFEME